MGICETTIQDDKTPIWIKILWGDWEKAKEIVESSAPPGAPGASAGTPAPPGGKKPPANDQSGVSMIDLLKRQAQWLTEGSYWERRAGQGRAGQFRAGQSGGWAVGQSGSRAVSRAVGHLSGVSMVVLTLLSA